MSGNSITSVNAVFMLAISGLYTIPQQIQGFSAEDIFDNEVTAPAEVSLGLDGKLSAGFIPVMVKQSITLQADSDSNLLFEAWDAAQKAAKEIYRANGILRVSSINKSYVLTNGVLTSYPVMADAKKILSPRKYGITWESVVGAPL